VLNLKDLFAFNPIEPFDIIFADPFYRDTEFHFDELYDISFSLLNENGLFILEHGAKNSFSNYTGFISEKHYGDTSLSLFTKNQAGKSL
jgi:16S rRNA G966 N2-methylase RsmD